MNRYLLHNESSAWQVLDREQGLEPVYEFIYEIGASEQGKQACLEWIENQQ